MGKDRVNIATATQGDECCAGPSRCDRNTEDVLLTQPHIESGMAKFRSWGWRMILDRNNKTDHFHFWPRWSKRNGCKDQDTRQRETVISEKRETPRVLQVPQLTTQETFHAAVCRSRENWSGLPDLSKWSPDSRETKATRVCQTKHQSQIFGGNCINLWDLDFYILPINKSVNWCVVVF